MGTERSKVKKLNEVQGWVLLARQPCGCRVELALLAPLFLFVMFSFVELFQYLRASSASWKRGLRFPLALRWARRAACVTAMILRTAAISVSTGWPPLSPRNPGHARQRHGGHQRGQGWQRAGKPVTTFRNASLATGHPPPGRRSRPASRCRRVFRVPRSSTSTP